MTSPIRIAACHASPIFLSAQKTTDKTLSLIQQAAKNKANLVVFPETYIPAFPIWSAVRPPTFFEKLTRAPGDGYGLRLAETRFGKIGNSICGENTNPLARYALMSQGEQIHISTWPAIWPTRIPTPNATESDGSSSMAKGANYDNVSANRTRAAAHCFEAKCFGVLCSGELGDDAIEMISSGSSQAELVAQALKDSQRGATMFPDPVGSLLHGFTVDMDTQEKKSTEFLQASEGILYADMDVGDCIEGKQYHDVVGGYQRLDVFDRV